MWLLTLWWAFISAVSATSASDYENLVFPKCCPKDHSLVIHTDMLEVQHDCVDNVVAKREYNISRFSRLIIPESVPVRYGTPENCTSLQMVITNGVELDLEANDGNICYDKNLVEVSNGTLRKLPKTIALTCNNTENQTKPMFELHRIRKCCPDGQAYDVERHTCKDIAEKNDVEDVMSWLHVKSDSVYDVEIGLVCKPEEFAVELTEDKFTVTLIGNVLNVKSAYGENQVALGDWCVDRQVSQAMQVTRVCTDNCDQYKAYCLKKCCPTGFHYKPFTCSSFRSRCVPDDEGPRLNISSYLEELKMDYDNIADVVGLGVGITCTEGKFGLNKSSPADQHWLTRDRHLVGLKFDYPQFCFEAFDWRHCPGGDFDTAPLACFVPDVSKNFKFSAVANTMSAVFLFVTLVVYCGLPELHNLHGRTVICHVGTMLVAYSCLARVQFDKVFDPTLCTFLGYGIYFGFVGAFFWLNVMCFDIWWTFGSVQMMRKQSTERRRFLWYSMYAWSITLLLTIIMFLFDKFHVTDVLDANIGRNYCWFNSEQNDLDTDKPHYVFFVAPMGIVTSINLVLWILTARHCSRVKSEVHRLQAGSVGDRAKKRFRIDRAKYLLTGKLWVVMGAGWISELISTLITKPQWLWEAVDLVNELQGVFIFLILVFKPKVYFLIKKRLGCSSASIDSRLVKPDAQKNGISSGRTSSTFLSRTISSDERTNLRASLPSNDTKRT